MRVEERAVRPDFPGAPEGFHRYAMAAFGDTLPTFSTVAFRGRARMRPGGRGMWLPATAATTHRLGEEFAGEFAIAPFGRTVARGTDGFLDGHGASSVAGRPLAVSPELDRSARMFMWMEAGLFPQTWTLSGVRLEQPDDLTLRIHVPPEDQVVTWRLDAATGFPWRIEGMRYRGAGGPAIHQRIDLGPWRRFGDLHCWSQARVTWADEAAAWFDWQLESVEPDVDVEPAFERVRAAAQRSAWPPSRPRDATTDEAIV